jgi:hypothetical protein
MEKNGKKILILTDDSINLTELRWRGVRKVRLCGGEGSCARPDIEVPQKKSLS